MARANLRLSPRGNPCAQCSQPIISPDWVEERADRVAYLWTCRACNYRFEAVAFLDARQATAPLAA